MIWHGIALGWCLGVALAVTRPETYTFLSILNGNIARINTMITSVALGIYTMVAFQSPTIICSTIIISVTLVALSFTPKQTPYTPLPFVVLLWVAMAAVTTFNPYGIAYFTFTTGVVLVYVYNPNDFIIAWVVVFFIIQLLQNST